MLVVALILFFYDKNYHSFASFRARMSFIAAPFQFVVNEPIEIAQSISNYLVTKNSLQKENTRLRSELLLIHAQVQRLSFLEQENSQLHLLLDLTKQIKSKVLIAQLSEMVINGMNQQITINKGTQNGVYVGQPVLDAYGLFGQVIAVDAASSKILMITDTRSAIPAMIVRNSVQVILVGLGNRENLELVNIPETADVKVGDVLVTSGLGKRFPAGYPVGIIKTIQHVSGERFLKITVVGNAHFASSRQVVLIWTANQK